MVSNGFSDATDQENATFRLASAKGPRGMLPNARDYSKYHNDPRKMRFDNRRSTSTPETHSQVHPLKCLQKSFKNL